jgi:hypothetical protein
LISAGSGGLALPGNRGDPNESDALSAITSSVRWRCPLTVLLLFLHPMYWLVLLMTPPQAESQRLNMRWMSGSR